MRSQYTEEKKLVPSRNWIPLSIQDVHHLLNYPSSHTWHAQLYFGVKGQGMTDSAMHNTELSIIFSSFKQTTETTFKAQFWEGLQLPLTFKQECNTTRKSQSISHSFSNCDLWPAADCQVLEKYVTTFINTFNTAITFNCCYGWTDVTKNVSEIIWSFCFDMKKISSVH